MQSKEVILLKEKLYFCVYNKKVKFLVNEVLFPHSMTRHFKGLNISALKSLENLNLLL